MSCYFIISVSLEPGKDRADYDDYIKLVRPIVEKHGGRYVVRSEGIEYMGKDWRPDRFIMIWFPDRENTVDSQAVIITAGEMYGDDRDKREGKMG